MKAGSSSIKLLEFYRTETCRKLGTLKKKKKKENQIALLIKKKKKEKKKLETKEKSKSWVNCFKDPRIYYIIINIHIYIIIFASDVKIS